MKDRKFAAGVVLGVLTRPVAAYAQMVIAAIVGGVIAGPVGAAVGVTIGCASVMLFNAYVARNKHPVYVHDVAVGAKLPAGIAYFRVPPEYGTGFYTVLNGHTVLIDPATRRIVQVVR